MKTKQEALEMTQNYVQNYEKETIAKVGQNIHSMNYSELETTI